MKKCLCCGALCAADAPTCVCCGEASWSIVAVASKAEAKKAEKPAFDGKWGSEPPKKAGK